MDRWQIFPFRGVAILEHENLRIEIMEDTMFSENRKLLNKDDGYFVTHAGVIQYCDGNPLSVAEAEHIIRGLRALLSFARGSACGITLVKAINQNDDGNSHRMGNKSYRTLESRGNCMAAGERWRR